MQIKISNEHLENDNGDLRLFQPKYHFGQMLTTSKGQSGIVVEMGCSAKWRYLLLEAQSDKLLDWYAEDELAVTPDEDTKEENITLQTMSIKIFNKHLEKHSSSLRFTQPKYYFGQLMKDKQGFSGLVIQMRFKGEWEYELLELTTEFPSLLALYLEPEIVPVETALLAKQ